VARRGVDGAEVDDELVPPPNILNEEVLRARLGYVRLRLVGLLLGYCWAR
jgi:hypothetical protein